MRRSKAGWLAPIALAALGCDRTTSVSTRHVAAGPATERGQPESEPERESRVDIAKRATPTGALLPATVELPVSCDALPPKPEQATPTRVRSCRAAARNMLGVSVALAAGVAAKLLGDDELWNCIEKSKGAVGSCIPPDLEPELGQKLEKAVHMCLRWSDDAIACMADFKKMQTPKCLRAWEKEAGVVDSKPLGKGPKVAWRHRAKSPIMTGEIAGDERLVLVTEKTVFAIIGGRPGWSRRIDALLVGDHLEGPGCVPVAAEGGLHCLSDADGTDAFSVAYPDDFGPEALARDGNVLIVGGRGGAMLSIDGPACVAGRKACRRVLPSLPRFVSDYEIVAAGDYRAVFDISTLVFTDREGKLATDVLDDKYVLHVAPGPERSVLVSHSGGISLVEPPRCVSAKQRQDLVDCASSTRMIEGGNVDPGVARLDGNAILFEADMDLRRWSPQGCWAAWAQAFTGFVVEGTKVVVASQDGVGNKPHLAELDLRTGATRWRIPLGMPDIYKSHGGEFLLRTKTHLVVVVGSHVAAVPWP